MTMIGDNERPYRLALAASDAKAALDLVTKGEADAIEGWLAYGAALNEGRALFPSDERFGQWVRDSGVSQLATHEVSRDERAAAMWAAANSEQFEEARAAGNARTVRGIYAKWKEIEADRAVVEDERLDDHSHEYDEYHSDDLWGAAAETEDLSPEDQVEIVAHGETAILAAAKEIRAKKAAVQREARLEKIAEISAGNTELNTETRYPIIYADPPWRYENPPIGSSSRAIENHYPTMTLEEICEMPVTDLAAPDAMLYLWATAPKLEECFEVIRAWGFEYRTHMVWDKEKIGMGYHARNQHG